jgi:hypothetical protein
LIVGLKMFAGVVITVVKQVGAVTWIE